MLLIAGPPASGKTSYCLDRLREAVRSRDAGVRLLVPTTTMAEHLRNQLVREGFVFSPAVISTFSKFVRPFTGGGPVVSTAALELIVADFLERLPLETYQSVRDFSGFRRALVGSIEEFASAGGDAEHLRKAGANADFQLLYREVAAELKRRGWQFRSTQLRRAAELIRTEGTNGVRTVYMTGFFSFTPPELDVIRAVAAHADITVAVTEWEGAKPTLRVLREFATREQPCERTEPDAARLVVKASTLDQEATDIARRILQEVEAGRQFREIGILLRSADPYVPALRTALERFGIPARFYFGDPLPANVTVRYLVGLVDCMLGGWEHEQTLDVLRLPGSPLERNSGADRFDHTVRAALPGSGLSALRGMALPSEFGSLFDQLERLTPWEAAKLLPGAWATRFLRLRSLVAPPEIDVPQPHERSLLWREQALALNAFDSAVEETRDALPADRPLRCVEFNQALKTVLAAHTLRNIDHRRNVVHIIDAFEARQWKLPVVFVPGMLEKQFPRYHSENPVLPDDVRGRLQAEGVPLRKSSERQTDEEFLFRLALTRARDKVVLSYPELNSKGDANLPSFFLEKARPFAEDRASETRPRPSRAVPEGDRSPVIYDEALRAYLAGKHVRIAATAIETFLQCPYQFFANRTLRLKEAADPPDKRLAAPSQGTIVHRALELRCANGLSMEVAFQSAFEEESAAKRIPDGYRTEAVRLDLLHNLRLLEEEGELAAATESLYEHKFELDLGDVTVRGKIDRVEIDGQKRAALIDYKYRSPERTRGMKKQWDEGALVQAGLYAIAVRRMGYEPARVAYKGLKREVSDCKWETPDELASIMQQAHERTLTVVQQMRDGRIEPVAFDEDKCRFCAHSSACRKETHAKRAIPAGGTQG